MEVLVHRRVEEEEVVEQLLPRQRRADDAIDGGESSDDTTINGGHKNDISDEMSIYFDNNKGIWKCHHCTWTHKIGQPWIYHLHQKPLITLGDDTKVEWSENNLSAEDEANISKLVTAMVNQQNLQGDFKDEILYVSTVTNDISATFGAQENVQIVNVVEESDEDEDGKIELEFERAVERVHTHTPYCPHCSKRITKVILRRKKSRPSDKPPLNVFSCFNCLTVFIPSGAGGRLNPFGWFTSKPNVEGPNVEPSINAGGTTTNLAGTKPKPETPKGETSTNLGSTTSIAQGNRPPPFNFFGFKPSPTVEDPNIKDEIPSTESDAGSAIANAQGQPKPEHPPHMQYDIETGPDRIGGRPDETVEMDTNIVTRDPIVSGNERSVSLEIMKCIVYGGLIESIASLSIVSSAAASDATTLNVIVIGLATLLSGLIAFGCNLLEIQNDSSNNKYQEELGRRGHFLLHSTFAILSYLVFGLIAPTTYAFAFRDSDNKDYKILAVAAAAFASVFILAIAKAYVKGTNTFGGYCKTTSYYVTLAVSASGVAYVAGHYIGILLENVGWFDQDVTPLVSGAWASY